MQQVAVIIIGIFVFSYVAWRTYKLLTGGGKSGCSCAGCDADCALRDLKMRKDKKT